MVLADGGLDTLVVTTTTGSFTDTLQITKVADVAYLITNLWLDGDSILVAATGTETINVDSIFDRFDNFVTATNIEFSTDGDIKFLDLTTLDSVAHAGGDVTTTFGITGGEVVGDEKITAKVGGAIAYITPVYVYAAAPDSVALKTNLANPVAGQEIDIWVEAWYGEYHTTISSDIADSLWRSANYSVEFDLADSNSTAVGRGLFGDKTTVGDPIADADADTTGGSTGDLATTYIPYLAGADSAVLVVNLNGLKDTLTIESGANDELKSLVLACSNDSIATTSTMNFTVTAWDSNDVVKANYVDSLHIYVTGSANPNLYFANWDTIAVDGIVKVDSNTFSQGVFEFTIEDTLAETFDVIVKDVTSSIADTIRNVDFYPDIVDSLELEVITVDIYAGDEFDFSVKPVDTYGNENYSERVSFFMTAKDPGAAA